MDMFASEENFRLPRFASLLASETACHRNAFTLNWKEAGYSYFHPPVPSIGAVIKTIVRDQATGILIVPHWVTMKDWLFICQDGVHVNRLFPRVLMFRPRYVAGKDVVSLTFAGTPKFQTLALVFDGAIQRPLISKKGKVFCTRHGCMKCQK